MGKVFTVSEQVPPPSISVGAKFNRAEYMASIKDYEERIREFLKANIPNQYDAEFGGRIVNFPVADGYARYMVISLKPVKLVHLENGDAYSFQYITSLSAKDIKDKLKAEDALNKLFSK